MNATSPSAARSARRCCAIVEGRIVVDLWGGIADRHTRRPWEQDTIGLVWSSTKGATALCAHLLISRGLLDLDRLVTSYWPEFGQAGKDGITVRMLLDHQAGLPAIRQPLAPGGLYDWQYMTAMLASEPPFWEPGTRQGYHATTFGHLVGELVRRVSGRPFDVFFREEVAGPLGLDFHIGLPEEHEPRVAPTLRADPPQRGEPPSRFLTRMATEPASIQALTVKNSGRAASAGDHDTRAGASCGAAQPGRHYQRARPRRDVRAAGNGGRFSHRYGDAPTHERRQFGDRN